MEEGGINLKAETFMMDNGRIIKRMGMQFFSGKVEKGLKGNIGMIRGMDMEFKKIKKEIFIKGTGKMILDTGREYRLGNQENLMMANGLKIRSMDTVFLCSKTEIDIKGLL